MSKAIKNAQSGIPALETRTYSDELTAKEMLKKYPKRAAEKKEALLKAMQKSLGARKAKSQKGTSKRTTPGTPPSDSSPAYPHREGKRWMKTTIEQIAAQRTIQDHHGRKKK